MFCISSKILFIAFILIIEYLATTQTSIPAIENSWDKANHLFAFAMLFITMSFGFKFSFGQKFIILLLYGLQIELIQSFIPNRNFSILDIFADICGIFIGAVLVKALNLAIISQKGQK